MRLPAFFNKYNNLKKNVLYLNLQNIMNAREFWQKEAAFIADKSAILGDIQSKSNDPNGEFQKNIIETVSKIFRNGVRFGTNSVRAKEKLFDTDYWVVDGAINLRLKQENRIRPSLGVNSIINNTSGKQTLDCTQFVQVVQWGAMLLTDKADEFDAEMTLYRDFILSAYSTGVKLKVFYQREKIDQQLTIDNVPGVTGYEVDALLKTVPIGSRIGVTNFAVQKLKKKDRERAESISTQGWGNENMVKIGDDRYAAFGIGQSVTLEKVRETLLEIYYSGMNPSKEERELVLGDIGVSAIQIFERH
jgi:Protein-glutamine gamma-glutamyltransferase